MAKKIEMRLCGGTFFVLLLEARGQRRNARVGDGRPTDGKSNPDILGKLVWILNPDFRMPEGRSFATFTSDYKLCKTNDTPAASITDERLIQKFNADIKNDYYSKVRLFYNRLQDAISWETKGNWLVAALIDLIEADETIADDELFYVRVYGQPVPKAELRSLECICTPAFVFGVWHYILTKRRDNLVGASTIDALLSKAGESRAERKFGSSIGLETAKAIKTSVDTPEYELQNSPIKYPEALTKIPFVPVAPGVSASVQNVKNGQVYVNGKSVFYVGRAKPAFPEDEDNEELNGIFDTYLEKSVEFYSMVKTLLYAETPKKFRDFYVPNDYDLKITGAGPNRGKVETPLELLLTHGYSNIIVKGTGGIGKSMMMRHLFLRFAECYQETLWLPVLAPLKNFTGKEDSLEKFVFAALRDFDRNVEFSDFEKVLETGDAIILLDGLDEIPTTLRAQFDEQLVSFKKSHRECRIVISSRPTTSFIQFGHFHEVAILPFSKDKALELIDKIEYHDPEAKAKFRKDLDEKLFRTHQQFASNPLLLTIMLMTYTSYGEVPAKRHIFYAKAYETMARLHDASKGAYVRPMHTGMSPEDFATYFAEFCARTYREEVLEFTEQTFTSYMNKVIKHQGRRIDATARDFLLDLTNNLCIMYKEGEKYYFIHRSFQEYFSAVFFSNQMDDQLERIGVFFENQRHRQFGDRTFDMLYDMIPTRIDKYVFLPMLKLLWEKCDAEKGYWTFLDEIYPTIFAQQGNPGDCYENDPISYLYNFIVNESTRRYNGQLYNLDWPSSIDYCDRKEWVSIDKPYLTKDGRKQIRSEIVVYEDVDKAYVDEYGEPEIEGISWEIQVYRLIEDPKFYKELVAFMEADEFPLMKEYKAMREFTVWLDKAINSKPSSDDWFDAF